MSRKKRKSRAPGRASEPVKPKRRKKLLTFALPTVLVGGLAITAYLVFFSDRSPATQSIATSSFDDPVRAARNPKSLDELLKISPERLKNVGLAEMNLLCATGLRGSESLDVNKCLSRLDEWAQRVRYWTEQSTWDFRRHPEKFKNSEAKFCVLLLISVLQKDFGVHYNDRVERNCDFSNAKNPFIHGMIDDTNGGTCASMPVLYVAIGRRLGYPMQMVLAKTHIFARWEDPVTGERFNIEGTNPRFDEHADSYYRNWPYPITDAELKQGWYLKPLTPSEELAVFLQNRAFCLMDNGRFKEAELAFRHSYRLAPQNPLGREQIAYAAAAGRPVYGRPVRGMPVRQFVDEFGAPMVYPDPMAEIERINAINRANMQRMTRPPQPPTRGVPQPPSPYGPNPHGPQPPHQPGRP